MPHITWFRSLLVFEARSTLFANTDYSVSVKRNRLPGILRLLNARVREREEFVDAAVGVAGEFFQGNELKPMETDDEDVYSIEHETETW